MGGIVKNWITNKLGLEIPQAYDPSAFRYEVANGVLIAEILRKYGLLSDDEFVSLRHNNSSKSRTANMKHVHKWLINAGMNLDENLMLEVSQEKPGCAVKFLYELFLWLENGPRKPNVGDKAKKYLSEQRKGPSATSAATVNLLPPPPEERIRRRTEERMSVLSSTWLHSFRSQQSELIGFGFEDDDQRRRQSTFSTRSRGEKKYPVGSFSSLDPPKIHTKRADPFNEISEAAQSEAIFFAEQVIDTYKKQERSQKLYSSIVDVRDLAETQPNQTMTNDYLPVMMRKERLQFRTKEQIRLAHINKAKLEERDISSQEIRRYDKRLKEKKKDQTLSTSSASQKVYYNGKGCPQQLKQSMQQLKCRRQKEVKAGRERNKCRKQAMSRMIQNIPNSMYEMMQNGILKLTNSLSTNEKILADFIYFGHQEKSLFKQHACYEAIQRQNARNADLEKEVQIEQEEKDLKRRILAYKYEQPVKINDEADEEEVRKRLMVEKVSLVEDIVENILELTSKIGDYRIAMGSALFGTETFNEAVESGECIQSKITLLDEERFIWEPEDLSSADEASYPPPKPSTSDSPTEYQFLPKHTAILLDAFLQIANGSLIPMKAFTSIIEDLILTSKRASYGELSRNECLPPGWLKLTSVEIKKIVYYVMAKQGFINWRNFLIATLDIKFPSQTELILTLKQFQHVDSQGFFYVDKTSYDSISLWFEPKPPCGLTEAFQALHLRECIFYMFVDEKESFFYIDFLLYFCKDADPILGIIKSLAVLTGCIIPTRNLGVRGGGDNNESALVLTESDLELLFDKGKMQPQTKWAPLVPPNTPMKQRMNEIRNSKTNLFGEHRFETYKNHQEVGSVPGWHNEDILLRAGFNEASTNETADFDSKPDSPGSNPEGLPETNVIPCDAFLQAMWFGNIAAYPVEDFTFSAHEYQKLQEFTTIAFEETHEKAYLTSDRYDDIYNAPISLILQHPFVFEIIKRYITFKSMDLHVVLNQVLQESELDLLGSPLMTDDDYDSDFTASEVDPIKFNEIMSEAVGFEAKEEQKANTSEKAQVLGTENKEPNVEPQPELPVAKSSVSVPVNSQPNTKGLKIAKKAKSNNPAHGKKK